MSIAAVWFRRDLRLADNTALFHALKSGKPLLPVFIFDVNILDELERNDHRVAFIYQQLLEMNELLEKSQGKIYIAHGNPIDVWQDIHKRFGISELYFNRDFEPYALERDARVTTWAESMGIQSHNFKDHLIFEPGEILKDNGEPYTIYTPFKRKWLAAFNGVELLECKLHTNFVRHNQTIPKLTELGFEAATITIPSFDLSQVKDYGDQRDFPFLDATTKIGPHLRFGTVSIRQIVNQTKDVSATYLSELIWREFFIHILFHFPQVLSQSFRPQYDYIQWENDPDKFNRWCEGKTGYPIVDAGMRELNATGHMHNRVRMVVASFLCKHLLIDWRWGEAYFAAKLNDFELASNNGNWQWAAGTGCDAAPYFRVFNPSEQLKKFDPRMEYTKRWVPELLEGRYPTPIVNHQNARLRAIQVYKEGLERAKS